MDGLIVARPTGVFQTRSFKHSTKVFEGDSAIDLHQRPLDDMLQLGRVDCTRPAEAIGKGKRSSIRVT